MALATRCPHCQTTFRVAHDQLKLRAGLVRCGACKEIFNGVEHLLRPDEMQQVLAAPKPNTPLPQAKAETPPPQEAAAASPAQEPSDQPPPAPPMEVQPTENTDADATPAAVENHFAPIAPSSAQDDATDQVNPLPAQAQPSDGSSTVDPLQRMTLMDITAFDRQESEDESVAGERVSYADRTSDLAADGSQVADTDDDLSQAIDSLQNKPWRSERRRKKRSSSRDGSGKGGKAEPNFMAHARRQKRYGKAMRTTMAAGSVVLFIALLLQGVYAFRHVIAAEMPEYRPVLTDLCSQLGCQVRLPAQIEKVSIESSELQSLPASPNKFTLVALLRNQAATDQAWPYLELTLNDMNEKPVARKVFQPKDYLASTEIVYAGFPEQSEHQVRIAFEMLQLKAAGYRLYLFYP
ncbi:MAG: DUF3426 domain-containing protein [Burkholderiaceae bacterium]